MKHAAAYCRVSTGKEEQKDSLKAQIEHYKQYASEHDVDVSIYYDEGLSGTKKDTRPGLMQMILDCQEGKIDTVITKSISRLSRNTVDCIEIVRSLLELDIGIIFEKEGINTKSMEGELMLSIMSSMAEDESWSISQNLKWGIRKRFKDGTYKLSMAPYGYDLDNGHLIINKGESATVDMIFKKYLASKGACVIANELNATGIKTRKGVPWSSSSILGILNNRVYTGDLVLQKTYTDEQFKRHINKGQKDMYLIENDHDAIITHKDFDKVQEIKQAKTRKFKNEHKTQRSCFSGKIFNGSNNKMKRLQRYQTIKGEKHFYYNRGCDHEEVQEKDIQYAFTVMMIKLVKFRTIVQK